MRRPLAIGILGVWVTMVALLVQRTWPRSPSTTAPVETIAASASEEWMGVYHQERKIGYTHRRLSAVGGGFALVEESLLRLTFMDTPQTVRTRMDGHVGPDFVLRDVDFELSSGVGRLQARAVVRPDGLHLVLRTGDDRSEQILPVAGPIYLPSTLRASLGAQPLRVGQELEALAFDPTTLKNDRVRITVESEEAVPRAAEAVRGWRVREEFRGLKTLAWIDPHGAVLREEGPMGFVLVRQSEQQALYEGWTDQAALDLVGTAAVPVDRPVENARQRTSLRLRLSGVAVEKVPSDDEQVRDGAVLTITRPAAVKPETYRLPYHEPEHASDLAATAFLQSDHPHVRAVARDVVGDEQDAVRVAIRLNDWVYDHLRKVPTVSIPNALQVLNMGEGDCNEHAVLLAALARAVGLPARTVSGAVYLDGAFFYHAWCEVWLGRWVSIDPALHQFPADATHIKFVVGGPDEQLAMMDIIGRLGIEVLDTNAGG